MKIENWAIERVTPYEDNPRLNDQAVDAVARSLQEFGWRQLIVVDADGVIVVGHTRWKAAKKMGMKKVPVHVAKDMTPAQVKAYRIADNQTNTLAEWDYDLLPIEIGQLSDMGFDLPVLGFSAEQISELQIAIQSPPMPVSSDNLNESPGARMHRNDGSTEVVAIGRFIGATDSEMVRDVERLLQAVESSNDAASRVCRIIIDHWEA